MLVLEEDGDKPLLLSTFSRSSSAVRRLRTTRRLASQEISVAPLRLQWPPGIGFGGDVAAFYALAPRPAVRRRLNLRAERQSSSVVVRFVVAVLVGSGGGAMSR